MCVIFYLKPGQLLPYKMLETATFNNPDGYGIILKENKKLQVIKELPENGNDPEVVQRILEENKDIERYCHLRWKTQGDISEQNTQPFTVYSSNKRHIEFMHNGTLNIAYDANRLGQIMQDAGLDTNSSDSRKFALARLAPLLLRFKGDNGPADISDPIFYEILDKLWSHNNRGILICNDLPHVTVGGWVDVIPPDSQEKILSSNNEYFYTLKRGKVFEQRKKEQEEKERAERESRNANIVMGGARAPFHEGSGKLSSVPFQKRYSISEEITELFEDVDMYSPEGLIALSNLTLDEVESFVKKAPKDFSMMFMILGDMFKNTFAEIDKLQEKIKDLEDDKEKATKRIATLVNKKEDPQLVLESAHA